MKVLIFGGSGLVGSKFLELKKNQFKISAPDASEVDILDPQQIEKSLQNNRPEVVINFAAFTNVEQAESQSEDTQGLCYKINVVGAGNVADACMKNNAHLLHISTEYIFDGSKETPYTEEDKPKPINWYGQTKYLAEQTVLESGCKLTIMRISMPYSAHYELKKDIARFFLEQLKNDQEIRAIEDQQISPTLVDDIADALAKFCQKQPQGLYHVCSISTTTPFLFAKKIAESFNLDSKLITPISFAEYNKNKKGKLLKNSSLNCAKFVESFGEGILHSVEESINIFKSMI